MSNVVFSGQIIYEENPEALVIDSNDKAEEKIIAEEKAYNAKKAEEARQRRLEQMSEEGVEIPEGVDPAEFSDLAESFAEESTDYSQAAAEVLEAANAEAESILNNARLEADSILNQAETDGETMRNLARQEGEKAGYMDGLQKAADEMASKQRELDEYAQNLEDTYRMKEANMERELVTSITEVFEKVFTAELSGRSDVIFHLLDNCLMNIEPSHEMQIKVSEENAAYLKEHKAEILERVGSEVALDIICDPLMKDTECIIDTDGGIFDCGIDTEMKELIKSIRALC